MTEDGKAGDLRHGGRARPPRRQAPGAGSGARPAALADPGQGLSELTQRRLGAHLRAMYDSVVQQPVPDRFRDLILKLDAGEGDKI
ncbi:NepR family anti-sigma factor [Methylobacterium planeticum]|uniref:Anti-sigma factor n=1 Tax=Methylobacterium planeticum TaxID=2615211 RepID=A0A6N6MMD0_9HYPH|nr:NepR family anti-sigma factor [Methylobacterium planeticum]KAB1070396.1 anti-sigma factor [Methylobacterium planeticum]